MPCSVRTLPAISVPGRVPSQATLRAEESFRLPLKAGTRCVSNRAICCGRHICRNDDRAERVGAGTQFDREGRCELHQPDAKLQACTRGAAQHEPPATIASDGTAYVKTGDIPAEWLRDASAQVRPYLFYAKSDPQVAQLLRAIIARMGKYLQIDPTPTRSRSTIASGAEVRTRFARVSDHAGVDVLERNGRRVDLHRRLVGGFDKALETMEREQITPRIPPTRTKKFRKAARVTPFTIQA